MILWIIQSIIISIVLIFLLHNLYTFFKDTLTVPIVKDLVNKPNEKYNEIISTFESHKKEDVINKNNIQNGNSEMKTNLYNFLNDLKKTSSHNSVMNMQ